MKLLKLLTFPPFILAIWLLVFGVVIECLDRKRIEAKANLAPLQAKVEQLTLERDLIKQDYDRLESVMWYQATNKLSGETGEHYKFDLALANLWRSMITNGEVGISSTGLYAKPYR
jgi:hypothetical protein